MLVVQQYILWYCCFSYSYTRCTSTYSSTASTRTKRGKLWLVLSCRSTLRAREDVQHDMSHMIDMCIPSCTRGYTSRLSLQQYEHVQTQHKHATGHNYKDKITRTDKTRYLVHDIAAVATAIYVVYKVFSSLQHCVVVKAMYE